MVDSILLTLQIFTVLCSIYSLIVWGRLILEWVTSFRPDFRPRGALLVICELVYTLTDPPVKFLRKIIPPINIGGARIDLSLMILIFAVGFLPFLARLVAAQMVHAVVS
ncbi:MAG: YggT family protein [Microbacteriaceae bacterium]|nr:YggT family protein [Microbacteriaceae bacterium]